MKYCVTWRWPKASYSVSSITCGWMPKRAAVSRSIVSVAVVPPICWSVVTSRSSGSVCSFVQDLRRPLVQLVEVRRPAACTGTCVSRRPPADAHVLRRLQEQRAALDLRELAAASRAMTCMRAARRARSRGFRVMNNAPVVARAAAPPTPIADA